MASAKIIHQLLYAAFALLVIYFPIAGSVVWGMKKLEIENPTLEFLASFQIKDSFTLLLGLSVICLVSRLSEEFTKTQRTEGAIRAIRSVSTIASGRVFKIGLGFLICIVTVTVIGIVLITPKKLRSYASLSRPYAAVWAHLEIEPTTEDTKTIVYLGDSNTFSPPDMSVEENGSSLPETHLHHLLERFLTKEGVKPVKVYPWAWLAAQLEDFYCLAFKALEENPDLIMIEINWALLRNESPGNYNPQLAAYVPLSPQYSDPIRDRGISLLDQVRYKLDIFAPLYLMGIRNWAGVEIKPHIFEEEPEFSPKRASPPPRRYATEKPRKTVKKIKRPYFVMQIAKDDNELLQLQALVTAIKRSRKEIPILFWVWPLNVERLKNEDLWDQAQFDQSIRLLEQTVEGGGSNFHFLDLSDTLGAEYFYDRKGHCKIPGRELVAKRLAVSAERILSEDQL